MYIDLSMSCAIVEDHLKLKNSEQVLVLIMNNKDLQVNQCKIICFCCMWEGFCSYSAPIFSPPFWHRRGSMVLLLHAVV